MRPINMMRQVVFVLAVCLGAVCWPLFAHETWILPATFSSKPGQGVALDLTSGMQFPEPEHAIHPDRVRRARYRLGGETADIKEFQRLDRSLRFTHSFRQAGLATVWVELHPKEITLTDEQVAEYLDEIGATAAVRESWARQKGREVWKETYTKHAKTWVFVGDSARDMSWKEPVGMALELVPLANPSGLRVGQKAVFRLILGGKPFPGRVVGLMTDGAKDRQVGKTNEDGEVSFLLGRAGRVLVFAVDLRRTKTGSGWESDFTTVTLQVGREE